MANVVECEHKEYNLPIFKSPSASTPDVASPQATRANSGLMPGAIGNLRVKSVMSVKQGVHLREEKA